MRIEPDAKVQRMANIPPELRDRDQWVNFDSNKRPFHSQRKTKDPVDATDPVDPTDPRNWSPFAAAINGLDDGWGAGYAIWEQDPYTGIDLDDCFDQDGELLPDARRFVELFDTYTEYSPSGKGLHLWIRGTKPGQSLKIGPYKDLKAVEVYDCKRYLTCTGNVFEDYSHTAIPERQDELEAFYFELFPREAPFYGAIRPLAELLAAEETADWIARDLIAVGDFVMLYGEPKTGKTFVALDLAYAIATGRPIFGGSFNNATGTPRVVHYYTAEGLRGLGPRLEALCDLHGEGLPPTIWGAKIVPQLFDSEQLTYVENYLRTFTYQRYQERPDVVVIDTLQRAALAAEENSATDSATVVENIARIQRELGAAVVLVHHANKSNGQMRGSSVYTGSADLVLSTSRGKGDGILRLACTHIKDARPFDDQAYEITPRSGSAVVSWIGDAAAHARDTMTSAVLKFLVDNAGSWFTTKSIRDELDIKDTQAEATLRALHDKNEIRREKTDPERPKSPSNPWVFCYDPGGAGPAPVSGAAFDFADRN